MTIKRMAAIAAALPFASAYLPSSGAAPTSRASAVRPRPASPIVPLHNIQDYNDHVLHPSHENELCVVRFEAPWCPTCRATRVSWERMASRLSSRSSSPSAGDDDGTTTTRIRFLSVELDGTDGTAALVRSLGIEGVPRGVLHHPASGVEEERVALTRPKLGVLRRNLERYRDFATGEAGLRSSVLLDGLREG